MERLQREREETLPMTLEDKLMWMGWGVLIGFWFGVWVR